MNEETYKTSDLYLASYLMLKGRKLASIKRATARKSMFIFVGNCDVEVDDFYNGDGKQFLDYAQALRDLKAMMYASMEVDEADGEINPENLRKGYRI